MCGLSNYRVSSIRQGTLFAVEYPVSVTASITSNMVSITCIEYISVKNKNKVQNNSTSS